MTAMAAVDSATSVAAAIGDPTRSSMLFCLMDGRPRTSTELALIAGVSPSTASAHLARLKSEALVSVAVRGRRRVYSLHNADVAEVLERLSVLANRSPRAARRAPEELRHARACYDHLAGVVGVAVHDRFVARGWIAAESPSVDAGGVAYVLTSEGAAELTRQGVAVDHARTMKRRFAFGCVDWTERRPHLAGALGASLLSHLIERRWLERQRVGRGLDVTALGRRGLRSWLDLSL